MRFIYRLAVVAAAFPLTIALARADSLLPESGGVPLVKTTTVVPTNTSAGINNGAVQNVGNIANQYGGPGVRIKYGNGVSAPLVDVTTVVATNTAAGINNFGGQSVGSIANGPAAPGILLLKRR